MDPAFIAKYNLSHKTKAEDFVGLFLLFGKNQQGKKEMVSFELLTKWTNLKATFSGAGKGGTYYTDCVPFSGEEIHEHVGLYVFHGLSASLSIEFKFRSQHKDKVHGNYLIHRSLGPNVERLHKHFNNFLLCQNPTIDTPDSSKYPNWKVRPLLTWMNLIFTNIWLLDLCFSIDEMTMRFQGQHKDKYHITYKTEGDGFQADALCEEASSIKFTCAMTPYP